MECGTLRVVREFLVLFENYAGLNKDRNCMLPCILSNAVPQSIFLPCVSTRRLSVALLYTSFCIVQFSRCSALTLQSDLKIQLPLGLQIQKQICLVGLSGLEPPTLRLSVVRSSQLSYRPIVGRNFALLASGFAKSSQHSILPPLQIKPASLGFDLVEDHFGGD